MEQNSSNALPRNNSRRLTSTLMVIERRLDELARILTRTDSPVMLEMDIHLFEAEKEKILNEIAEIRHKILELKNKYSLDARKESFAQTANSYISMSIVDLTDILSGRMKGYGKIHDAKLMEEYDEDIKDLTELFKNFPH